MNSLLSKRDAPQQRPLETLFAFPFIEGREDFCGASPVTVYPRACKLFRQRLPPRGVFCIHSGLVKLVNVTPGGKELLIGVRSPGWILGAASVILQKPYRSTAETLTHCELHYCSARNVMELAERDSKFVRQLLQLVSQELYDQADQLVMLGTLTAKQRLEHLLLKVTTPENGTRLALPLKLEEIAQWIAVEPAHLSRLLKEIENEGLIKRDKGWIIVTGLGAKKRVTSASRGN